MADKFINTYDNFEGVVEKVNLTNGNIQWSKNVGGSGGGVDHYPDEGITFGASYDDLYVIDDATGGTNDSIPSELGRLFAVACDRDTGNFIMGGEYGQVKLYNYPELSKQWQVNAVNDGFEDSEMAGGNILLTWGQGWIILDEDDGSTIKSVNNGSTCYGTIEPDGSHVYILNRDNASLLKYDIESDDVVWSITTVSGTNPDGVSYNSGRVLVGAYEYEDYSYWSEIDASTGATVYEKISEGQDPYVGDVELGASTGALAGGISGSSYTVIERGSGDVISSFSTPEGATKIVAGENFNKIEVTGTVTRASDSTPLISSTVTAEETGALSNVDGAGNYSLALPNGTFTLTAQNENYEDVSAEVTVSQGATADFVLSPLPAKVKGVIRDANGDPVGGQEVVNNFGNSAISSGDGSYTLDSPANATVQVVGLDGFDSREFETEPNSEITGVDFQYGGISVKVLGPDDSPLSGVEVGIGDNSYETNNTGGVSDLTVPPTAMPISVQRVDTGVSITPNEGEVVSYTEEAGKMAKLDLIEQGSLDNVGSLPARELIEGAVGVSKKDGTVTLVKFDGSEDMVISLGDGDRRYKTEQFIPEIDNGEVFESKIQLERRVAIGNK